MRERGKGRMPTEEDRSCVLVMSNKSNPCTLTVKESKRSGIIHFSHSQFHTANEVEKK